MEPQDAKRQDTETQSEGRGCAVEPTEGSLRSEDPRDMAERRRGARAPDVLTDAAWARVSRTRPSPCGLSVSVATSTHPSLPCLRLPHCGSEACPPPAFPAPSFP